MRESTIEIRIPPMTAIARGWSICEPAPSPRESGSMPAMVARAVIRMGRKRRRPACTTAASASSPTARKRCAASSRRMPFLATMPTTMMSPMNDAMLKVVFVMSSAKKTPETESNAEASMDKGAENVRNSKSRTMKTRTMASSSTSKRSRNEFCCCS